MRLRIFRVIPVIAMVMALISCATAPKTAPEFRAMSHSSMTGKVEKFDGTQSFQKLTQILKQKTSECLTFSLTETRDAINGKVVKEVGKFHAKIVSSPKLTELYLFMTYLWGTEYKTKTMPDGAYFLIADVTPAATGGTNIAVYRGAGVVVSDAIKAWASGETRGCPDQVRIMER